MAAAASVSSTFDLTLINTPAALGTFEIKGLGRTFRIQQILITGTAGIDVTVRRGGATGAIVSTSPTYAADVIDEPSGIDETVATFAAGQNVWVRATGGGGDSLKKVIVRCIAGDAEAVSTD